MEKSFCFSFTRYNYTKTRRRTKTNTNTHSAQTDKQIGEKLPQPGLSAGFLHGGGYTQAPFPQSSWTIFACKTFAASCCSIFCFIRLRLLLFSNSIEGWQRHRIFIMKLDRCQCWLGRSGSAEGLRGCGERVTSKALGRYGYYCAGLRIVSTCLGLQLFYGLLFFITCLSLHLYKSLFTLKTVRKWSEKAREKNTEEYRNSTVHRLLLLLQFIN